MARVTFLGLNMDVTTEAQVVAAVRGLYPELVSASDSDARAVQLVLKHIITEHVKTWAARSAITGSPEDAADAARVAAAQAMQAAGDAAKTAVTADIQPTATS